MSLQVVVYAEGAGERLGRRSRRFELPKRPGDTLLEQEGELGAAHFLARRAIAHVSQIPKDAVQFEEPLRHRGMVARGSHLTNPTVLPSLLVWPEPTLRPELAVVFVDCDGKKERRQELENAITRLKPRAQRVIAVAVQEFEAWLISDISAVRAALRIDADEPSSPEKMAPREAKQQLTDWITHSERADEDPLRLRSDIAMSCDLEQLANRCDSFRRFLDDLEAALPA
ncbi:MAG: DUF4276 family protein [Persicimonas sp.]